MNEHKQYLKKIKIKKILVLLTQIIILISFFITWEYLSKNNIINPFLYSSPSKILETIKTLLKDNSLYIHTLTTLKEIIISFILSISISLLISSILYHNDFLSKVLNPYLTILNSLPKVSLGPLIIIIIGANIKSVIIMSLLISTLTTTIDMYNYFKNTNINYIKLLKSYKISKYKIFINSVIPSNKKNIITSLKINMSLTLTGVIMGELLTSKSGLGYLIMYSSQIFNITLLLTSVLIISILSTILYYLIIYIEKKFC